MNKNSAAHSDGPDTADSGATDGAGKSAPSVVKLGLTPRQSQVLSFIKTYTNLNGYAPRYVDIQEAIGLKTKSQVHRIVDQLVDRGRVNKGRGRRSVAVL